jgi:predicted RNA binding protein YcfA (HicA-like mRNA interferase family)
MVTKRVTFGQLSKALKSLGFEEKIGKGQQRIFRHGGTGALIVLPRMATTATVSSRHLAAIGKTLEHFEIAGVLEFGALLHPSDEALR